MGYRIDIKQCLQLRRSCRITWTSRSASRSGFYHVIENKARSASMRACTSNHFCIHDYADLHMHGLKHSSKASSKSALAGNRLSQPSINQRSVSGMLSLRMLGPFKSVRSTQASGAGVRGTVFHTAVLIGHVRIRCRIAQISHSLHEKMFARFLASVLGANSWLKFILCIYIYIYVRHPSETMTSPQQPNDATRTVSKGSNRRCLRVDLLLPNSHWKVHHCLRLVRRLMRPVSATAACRLGLSASNASASPKR